MLRRRNAWQVLARDSTNDTGDPDDLVLVTGSKIEVMVSDGSASKDQEWCQCRVVAVGGSEIVGNGVRQLLNPWDGWTVGGTSVGMRQTDPEKGDPCEFAVLELNAGDGALRTVVAEPLTWRDTRNLRHGEAVALLASPFGALSPSIFLNSVATGVVSNFVRDSNDEDATLILTDARCLPCSEGGPVVDESGKLIGLVLPPLAQRNGQTVGYALVAPMVTIRSFLEQCAAYGTASSPSGGGVVRMVKTSAVSAGMQVVSSRPSVVHTTAIPRPAPAMVLDTELIDHAGQSLAMVCVGSSWASGILVSDRGHILTNAHVFHTGSNAKSAASRDKKNYPAVVVWIKLPRPGEYPGNVKQVECKATIIYKSDGPLDVALLQAVLPTDGRQCVPIDLDESFRACTHLRPGEPVAAYGHALYGTHFKQRRPSLSVGNLSKVVSLQDRPSMLQSSAAVHGGNSGGMLVNAQGVVLGMVTSNVRHTPPPNSYDDAATRKAKDKQSEEGGALLVELNFSMPLVALEELLQVAGIFDPTLMVEHKLMDLEIQVGLCPNDYIDHTTFDEALVHCVHSVTFMPVHVCCSCCARSCRRSRQAELDQPDDQLAALWALNLEQEQEYKAKVDTPPGGPRFQRFMEEFQVRAPSAASTLKARHTMKAFCDLALMPPCRRSNKTWRHRAWRRHRRSHH